MIDRKEFFYGFLFLSSVFSVISCGKKSIPAGPIEAYILHSSQGSYELGTVRIETLEQAEHLKGHMVEIKGSAVVGLTDEINGVVYSEDPDRIYSEAGKKIQLDYKIENDIVYPLDYKSMSLLAMYYNFETTFDFWENQFDLSSEDFGYTTIQNDPVLSASSGSNQVEATFRTNAAFIGGVRDLWFFRESEFEKVPFKINKAVMAHEFFHSVFDLYFYQKSVLDRSDNSKNVLRSINEGLADYFAFVVTGNPKEIGLSSDILADQRDLPVDLDVATANFGCGSNPYCYGSILASALYEIVNQLAVDRIDLGIKVLSAVKALRADWMTISNIENFTMSHLLNRLLEQEGVNRDDYCPILELRFNDNKNSEVLAC